MTGNYCDLGKQCSACRAQAVLSATQSTWNFAWAKEWAPVTTKQASASNAEYAQWANGQGHCLGPEELNDRVLIQWTQPISTVRWLWWQICPLSPLRTVYTYTARHYFRRSRRGVGYMNEQFYLRPLKLLSQTTLKLHWVATFPI